MPKTYTSVAAYLDMIKKNVICDCGHTVDSYLNHCQKKRTRINYTSEDYVLYEIIFGQIEENSI